MITKILAFALLSDNALLPILPLNVQLSSDWIFDCLVTVNVFKVDKLYETLVSFIYSLCAVFKPVNKNNYKIGISRFCLRTFGSKM